MANKLTAQFRDRAASLRRELLEILGWRCAKCGKTKDLEFDHIDPSTRTWVARRCSQLGRMKRYYEEALDGLIQILCKKCNKKKGDRLDQNAGFKEVDAA